MRSSAVSRDGARPSFGTRVAVIDRVLGGQMSRATACQSLAVAEDQLDEYLREHARDRLLSLDELRMPAALGSGAHELWLHLKRLESLVRDRHRELVLLRQIARGRGLL